MTPVYLSREAKAVGLMLGRQLGEGASGKVYTLPDMKGFAAKIYHTDEECRKYEAKIEAMLAHPPDLPALVNDNRSYPQIAWPEAKLYDRAGKFIGFIMPEIDFARSTSLVNLLQKSSRRAEKISEYYGYRVLVARNLASVFAELHRAGHYMIDMKPANLRFYPEVSWMAVVDADGFAIAGPDRRLPAEQVSDEYIAPEGWQKKPAELGLEQDLFALAVIIFQLLDNGVHPFAGSPKTPGTQGTDLQTRIQQGLYPYGLEPHPELGPSTASVHRMFRRGTRALFDRAFVPGAARPSAAQWRDHLDQLLDTLTPCAAKPAEHAHFGAGCGFCGHDARVEAAARQAPARSRKPAPRRPLATVAPAHAPQLPPRTGMRGARLAVGRVRARQPFRMPRPAFQWWQGWPLLLLFALLALTSDELWRRVSPKAEAGLRAAGLMTVMSTPGEPVVQSFAEPRGYAVTADDAQEAVALRKGPGTAYPVIERLSLSDPLIGRGATRAPDGERWIWVVRDRDGMAGYVPASALVLRPGVPMVRSEAAPCEKQAVEEGCTDPPDARPVTRRYRAALARATGYDRVFLMEQHQLWLEQRADCALREFAGECVAEADRRVLGDLRAGNAPSANVADAVPPPAARAGL